MSDICFTKDQQQVIDARNCNVLVSAAAGSGKTAVLVERIIRLITDVENPIDIDQILVVTFTNAAAAQMREKISKAIHKKLMEEPDNEHLERQAALVHNAQITTIDSFCLFVIRNNFNDIGLEPGFRIGDEGEMKLLKNEVLANVLEAYYEEGCEEFLYMTDAVSMGSKDKELEEYILNLYETAMSYPWPEKWIKKHCKDYACGEMGDASWFHLLLEQTADVFLKIVGKLKLCEHLTLLPDGPYMYGELIERELETASLCLTQIKACSDYGQAGSFVERLIQCMKSSRLSTKKDDSVDPDKRELVKELRTEIKKELDSVQEKLFLLPEEQVLLQMENCDRVLRTLCEVTLSFMEQFSQAKRAQNILDFTDIEHLALAILISDEEDEIVPRKAALEYQEYFAYVMIDEYQDSNLVQEYLLSAVSKERIGMPNRFMVGDVKQSIYKFRLARPELFLEKYAVYEASETAKNRKIDLHQNFRSRKQVLDSTNDIFKKIMGKDLGGISYDEKAALHLGAGYPDEDSEQFMTELLLFPYDKEENELSLKETEAYGICRRIKELLETATVTDEKSGALRPVRFGDIVILFRSMSGFDEVFLRVMQEQGIPANATSRTGYFAAYEIRTLLQLLKIIDNPLQDIPFFGVLRSFVGGFDDGELAQVRSLDQERSDYLYENLKKACEAPEICETLQLKAQKFLQLLSEFRDLAGTMSIHELLVEIFKQTHYEDCVTAMSGGQKRLSNVRMFLQKAMDFEKTSYYGLYHFVRYMEQLEKYEVDYGEANTLGEQADVVRLMSIHKSKGLEFPVCIVAGLGKGFHMMDSRKHFIVDADMGVGMYYSDPVHRISGSTLRRRVLAEKIRQENLAEELRILYVAMTRAKEKLILCGCDKKIYKKLTERSYREQCMKVGESLDKYVLLEASSMLDWLIASYDESSVRLIIKEEENIIAEDTRDQVLRILNRKRLEHGELAIDDTMWEKVKRCYEPFYFHTELANLPAKTSVSELKLEAMREHDAEAHYQFERKEHDAYIPRFMGAEETNAGAFYGTAYHKYLELFAFAELSGMENAEKLVEAQLERMLSNETMPASYRNVLSIRKLAHFMQTDLAKRMGKAAACDQLFKEQPFVLGVSANRLREDIPKEEMVLIQGIIDVFWEEDDNCYLLDYKTDRVSSRAELVDRYRTQIDYYRSALEQMGKKVKVCYLYSFSLEEVIEL